MIGKMGNGSKYKSTESTETKNTEEMLWEVEKEEKKTKPDRKELQCEE